MKKVTFFSFFALSVSFSFSSFQFLQNLSLRMYSVFFSLTFSFVWILFSLEKVLQLLLYLQLCQLALQVSLQLYFFLSVLSHYDFTTGGNKVWLTTIFLIRIIIWIILWYSRDSFEAFLRYKFSQNTNYKSSTICFTNKVERGLGSTLGWASQAWKTQY